MGDESALGLVSGAGRFLTLGLSPGLGDELARLGVGLACTTSADGRLVVIGPTDSGVRSVVTTVGAPAAGLCTHDGGLLVAAGTDLLDVALEGAVADPLAPVVRRRWPVGPVDTHEVVVSARHGGPVFVNTRWSCLAVPTADGWEPIWRPPWLSDLGGDDRCHLNAVALRDGVPDAVTCFAVTDAPRGWADASDDAGVVVEVESGEMMVSGLCSPHAPRWHDGRLWLVESGTGWLGFDAGGRFERVAPLDGYGRGLTFLDRWTAVVALSWPHRRQPRIARLADALHTRGVRGASGLAVVDLESGRTVHRVHLATPVGDVFDVAVRRVA